MFANLLILAFALLMMSAAWSDLVGYRIANWIPAAIIALWPVAAFALGLGWTTVGVSLLVFFAVLAISMALWAPGFIGGGDAKLIAAAALWFSWPDVLAFLFWCVIAGGALAVMLLLGRRLAPALRLDAGWVAKSPLADGAPVPYAVAIAAGALIALPSSHLLGALAG